MTSMDQPVLPEYEQRVSTLPGLFFPFVGWQGRLNFGARRCYDCRGASTFKLREQFI